MEIIIRGEPQEIAALILAVQERREGMQNPAEGPDPSGDSSQHYSGSEEGVPAWLEYERSKWLRFELVATDKKQIYALNNILEKAGLSRYELAVIVASLRVRPGFSLEDFDT